DLEGMLDGTSLKQIQSASLQLTSPDERLTSQLAGRVADVGSGTWPVQVTWQGQIADWLPRLEPWVNLTGWDLAGNGNVQALVSYSPTRTEVQESKISLDRLHVWGPGLWVDEPRVDMTCAGKWDSV